MSFVLRSGWLFLIMLLPSLALSKPTAIELMRGTRALASIWREASLPQNRTSQQDIIAQYQRLLDTASVVESPFKKWYVAMAHFGLARANARLQQPILARQHVEHAIANDFWNLTAMRADPILHQALGGGYFDSIQDVIQLRVSDENAHWPRQVNVVFGPNETKQWAKLGKLDDWFGDDELRKQKLDSMYLMRWQELVSISHKDTVAKPPVIIALHGGNASYREFASQWSMIGQMTKSYVIVPPGTSRFSNTINGWESEYGQMDEYLLSIIEQLRDDQGRLPQIYLTGYSQGACLAMKFGMVHPDIVKGVVSFAGFMDAPADPDLISNARQAGLKIYAESGEYDSESFRKSLKELKSAFDREGAKFEFNVTDGMIHELPQPLWQHFLKAWGWIRASA